MPGGRKRKRIVNEFSQDRMNFFQTELESTSIKDETVEIETFKNMFKAWTKEELCCIVTLKCGTKSIRAHKKILISASEYFKGLFRFTNQLEHTLNEAVLKEIFLEPIVWFAYTGKINIDGNCVQELLIEANYLQIDFITRTWEAFMAKNITLENVVSLIPFANQFDLNTLMNEICRFVSDHFKSVLDDASFFELDLNDVIAMLKNVNLSVFEHGVPVVNPEIDLLKFIGLYLDKTKNKIDKSVVSNLLEEIRFDEIKDYNDLKAVLDVYPCLDCPKMQDIIRVRSERKQSDLVSNSERRKFSNKNKYLKTGPQFLTGWNISTDRPFEYVDKTDRPAKFTIWVAKTEMEWDIVGAISIQYQSGNVIQHGNKPKLSILLSSRHVFNLEGNEVITRIELRSSSLERFLVSIKFLSNFGREYGPFGGMFSPNCVDKPHGKRGFFHSMAGKVETSDYIHCGLGFLRFRWVCFSSISTRSPDDSDKEDK